MLTRIFVRMNFFLFFSSEYQSTVGRFTASSSRHETRFPKLKWREKEILVKIASFGENYLVIYMCERTKKDPKKWFSKNFFLPQKVEKFSVSHFNNK